MASQTTYLQLKLLGTSLSDKETYFEAWRQSVNGESNSNMQIIDAAYHDLKTTVDDIITEATIDTLVREIFA